MKKLNNRGWGLGMMLIFIAVFVLALIIIIIQANNLGIAGNMQYEKISPTMTPTLVPKPEVTNTPTIPSNESYEELERTVKNAAFSYQQQYYVSLQSGDSIYVSVRKLIEKNLLSVLVDKNGNVCSGYVQLVGGSNTSPSVYLKCDGYITPGYESYLDN